MSAKRTQTGRVIGSRLFTGSGLLTWAITLSIFVVPRSYAAPDGATQGTTPRNSSSAGRVLSRQDIDLLLREARSAIQAGQLDEADALITRAENARLHYPLFHLGPTPTSVRRELNRARAAGPSATNAAKAANGNNQESQKRAVGVSGNGLIDPFVKAGGTSGLSQATPLEPGLKPPSMATQTSQAATTSQPQHAVPAYGNYSKAERAIAPVAWENTNSPSGAAKPEVMQAAALGEAKDDLQWSLPDAPLPPEVVNEPGSASAYGLLPPRRAQEPAASTNASGNSAKQQVLAQLTEARQALDAGDYDLAEKLTRAANSAGIPESQFLPDEDRPSLVAWDIARARQSQSMTARTPSQGVTTAPQLAAAAAPQSGTTASPYSTEEMPLPTSPSMNSSSAAPTGGEPAIAPTAGVGAAGTGDATSSSGPRVRMLPGLPAQPPVTTSSDSPRAATPPNAAVEPAPLPPPMPSSPASAKNSLIDETDQQQQALARQLSAEVGKRQSEAQRLRTEDPERALAILREAQQMVNDSSLPESQRRELLNRIEITLDKTQKYIKDNAAEIDLDRQNEAVLKSRDRERELRLKTQQKIAESVEEFNRLRDEHRYAEAEIVAKRLYEIAPEDPVVQQVFQTAKFIRREMMNRELTNLREEGHFEQLADVEKASYANVGDGHELAFPKTWPELAQKRKGSKERIQRRSERELEIERKLKTPVLLRYQNTPLSQVAEELSELTGINIYLDPRGFSQEGIGTDSPVTLNLSKEITLQSALNLILTPLHLSYVIKDDVLKITSEQLRDGELVTRAYPVQDLVIPIPNFVPSNNIGLQGLINDALGVGGAAAAAAQPWLGDSAPRVLLGSRRSAVGGANDQVLAQQISPGPAGGMSPPNVPLAAGPGGMGGGANADFDSLIDLIISTVATETWAENGGGEAEIRPFPTNLSLVISQTQAVHEEIADLLEQLRRLQDLQVTIEVRFIRLNDNFFERIGIDFNANIASKINSTDEITHEFNNGGVITRVPPGRNSATVGVQRQATGDLPNFTSDLDIPFRQGGFNLAVPPPFSGFDPNSAARFGFAILSDIEAYFLIEAAQGDSRTNLLNAPKVTLFNGQQAFVSDSTQRPFVVGVIPVVGEFAAAQQPVIVVLNEGTMMTIQAVVSDDRRYVRMTIVPFFSQIGDVDEFTFEGSTSSTDSSSSKDDNGEKKSSEKASTKTETRSGVTVQLPAFSFVSVVTTVSVPDGGTVLLGGIKRLSEGRNEFGVPLLSKIPYINRLFRNVAIGRETDSLMMMVTPRIIIQEEEEERLGITVPGS